MRKGAGRVNEAAAMLPDDVQDALLVGRVDLGQGPTPVLVRSGLVKDMSRVAPTVADLLDRDDLTTVAGAPLFPVGELLTRPELLLAPIDLQVVKAAGVTFALSAVRGVAGGRRTGGDPRA